MGDFTRCETATFESDSSYPLESPRALKSAFRKPPQTQRTRWGQQGKKKQEGKAWKTFSVFIRWQCWDELLWDCLLDIKSKFVWYFLHVRPEHVCASCYTLKLLKPLKNRTKFQSCFSKLQLQKWMAKEPEQQCDTYFLTHKIVSCPWLLLRSTMKHIISNINYSIVTQSLLRLMKNGGWFGCLGKALGSILCSFVFEKPLIFGTGRKLKQCLWQQHV